MGGGLTLFGVVVLGMLAKTRRTRWARTAMWRRMRTGMGTRMGIRMKRGPGAASARSARRGRRPGGRRSGRRLGLGCNAS